MIVKLFDGTEMIISKAAGEKLNQALTRSSEGMVTINGFTIKKSAIAYTKPGGYTEADTAERGDYKLLQSDSRPQEEVYKIARQKAESIGEIIKTKGVKGLKKDEK